MKYVIIMNGRPQAGKDTFVKNCMSIITTYTDNRYTSDRYRHHHLSSINPVKDMCRQMGCKGESDKTPEWRSLMAHMKSMWDKTAGSTKYILNMILAIDDNNNNIIFVDIREPENIERIRTVLTNIGIQNTAVLVTNPRIDHIMVNNDSDYNVDQYDGYEHIIENSGTEDQLYYIAKRFMAEIIEMEE